jgi:hypothetical protein
MQMQCKVFITQHHGIIGKQKEQHQCCCDGEIKIKVDKNLDVRGRALGAKIRPAPSSSTIRVRFFEFHSRVGRRTWFIFRNVHTEPTHTSLALGLSLFEERDSRIASLETARRNTAPKASHTTTCAVDFLILSTPGIRRCPFHYCRRDVDR